MCVYYLYKILFHFNEGISTCDIIKVDIICTCRNRNVAAAIRSDKSTLTLIVLTFSKTPVSIIAPLVISTNLQATSRNLLLGKIPIVRSHLLQVDVITFIPLATYTYQTNILKLCRILVGKFCPLISYGREVGCECIVSILLLANVTSLITNSSSNSPLRNVIRHSLVSSLPKIRLKAQSTRGSINLAIFLCFIRSWTRYCYSVAKIRFFLVTSKVFGKNVGMMIMKMRVSTLSHLQK